ncbi:MAG: CDP-alcohol phosphatidyltransferase family protein [Thermoplasmatales archaeon]|nr:MAG: CDP-alcohol phosphatidyltransferase family protein [Thermoplasmatales archaeon]
MIKLLSIADLISLINACFGFLAILILLSDFTPFELRIRLSFSFILLALLADGLDGVIARKTRTGELGDYLEAMADMTSMGIAPSVFVYMVYYEMVSAALQTALIIILILFVVCSFIRLSSFHLLKKETYYVGIPASASTIFLLIASFLEIELPYTLLFIVVLSFATISHIRFPKPGLKVDTIAATLIVLTIAMGKFYYNVAPLLLFSALAVYSIVGPFYVRKSIS